MLISPVSILCVAAILVFSATLIYAAYTDLREMRITNKTCLAGLAAFAVYALTLFASGTGAQVLSALGVAAAVFTVTAVMNAKNLLGGGDVKLLTVLALWTGPYFFLDTFFIVALCGGVVAIFAYVRMQWFNPAPAGNGTSGHAPLDQRPIPYGPGITIAGLFLSSELILNALS